MLLIAFDDIGILQTNLLTRGQTHEFLLGFLHEVVTLNPQLTAELDSMSAIGLILRIVDGFKLFYLTFGVVGDDYLHRIENSRDTDGTTVEVVTDGTL